MIATASRIHSRLCSSVQVLLLKGFLLLAMILTLILALIRPMFLRAPVELHVFPTLFGFLCGRFRRWHATTDPLPDRAPAWVRIFLRTVLPIRTCWREIVRAMAAVQTAFFDVIPMHEAVAARTAFHHSPAISPIWIPPAQAVEI